MSWVQGVFAGNTRRLLSSDKSSNIGVPRTRRRSPGFKCRGVGKIGIQANRVGVVQVNFTPCGRKRGSREDAQSTENNKVKATSCWQEEVCWITGRGWVSGHTECGHRDRHLKRPMRGVCADPGQAFRIKQKSDAIGFPCKHAPLASGCMSVQRKAGRLASRDCNDAARDQEAMKWAPGTGPRHLFRVPSVCAPQNS